MTKFTEPDQPVKNSSNKSEWKEWAEEFYEKWIGKLPMIFMVLVL